jgi:hypothetical protein
MSLKIQCSEIGILAGYGAKFKSPREAAERFWKRNRPDRFKDYVNVHGPPEWHKKEKFCYENKDAKQIVADAQKITTANISEIGGVLKSVSDDPRAQSFTTEQKGYLEDMTRTRVFQKHGTRKEDSTLDQWCKQTGKDAYKPTKLYSMNIHEHVILNGYIDGITSDGELVEIKNRAKALFREVRDYEMAQCQAYLRMLNIYNGYLIESLSEKDKDPKLNTIPFTRDDEFWEDTVEKVLANIFDERFECFRVTETDQSTS